MWGDNVSHDAPPVTADVIIAILILVSFWALLAGTDYKWKQALWIGGTIALFSVLLVKLVGC